MRAHVSVHRLSRFRTVRLVFAFLLSLVALSLRSEGPVKEGRPVFAPRPVSTFSIVAIDPANGDTGVAVASR